MGYIMCVVSGREVVQGGFGCFHSLASGPAGEQVDRLAILICSALWKGTDEMVIYQQVSMHKVERCGSEFFFF